MPRKYKRKLGSRTYHNYTPEALQRAVEDILQGRLSLRKAAKEYGIPTGTISHKVNKKHDGKPGGRPCLTEEEEECIVKLLTTLSLWRTPVDLLELRMLVKSMLDKAGKVVPKFTNNTPGKEWAREFLARHKELTHRIAQNIKYSRAAVGPESINEYFDNLEESIRGVPAENIWNFDETNFTDDPGKKKAIVKRGVKYPERVFNQSKAAISVMYCGSAGGEVLPPYVVYKSEHLWERWCIGGPKGARFNRTRSGWFDGRTFYDWFMTAFLPVAKKQDGQKVLIGDNLSSHLDQEIIHECENNNIRFLFLPPNSTHLTQPLDVAYFGPLKRKWRSVLSEWKVETKSTSCLPKDEFPQLLKRVEEEIKIRKAENIKAGFRACGIYPVDRMQVLKRLPHENTKITEDVANESVLDLLRSLSPKAQAIKRKRSKVDVAPGKSISTDDFSDSDRSEERDSRNEDSGENDSSNEESSTSSNASTSESEQADNRDNVLTGVIVQIQSCCRR